jgi:hypothetical protein
MTTTVRGGAQITKDPQAKRIIQFNWDDILGSGVSIVTSTFTIAGPDGVLTKDNEAIVAGARKTSLRVLAGTVGATYTVTNHIITNETPAQEDDESIRVFIQQA